ncbi:flagellar hook-length control protein FliK [Clostridium boliviensis]|uniref:Flagellar hook-length control protein FliK n=1 Tax=Clostridium boliviensis TaxID=318465 RepID=A0ABU4GKK2_9CLOT|nr:flagellar hook-length control protein FliK [Clostridium boliviensis]MDW2798145.1 flagellar hook-length control protein FliK [Clostridium boliviensis]
MEMKTNSVDLIIRQMPKSQKTEESSTSDRSGFKKMMREKDLKKDTGNKDKKDLNKELETAASSAGVPQAPRDQKSDAAESKDQQEKDAMIQGLKSLNGQMPDVLKSKEDAADTKAMDSFQLLKEFRLKNWNPKDDSTLIQEKLDFNILNSQMPKKTVPDSQLGLEVQGNPLALPKDEEKKEVKGPGEALMKMSEQKGPGSEKLLSEKGPGVLTAKKGIHADGPGYRLKTDEKDNLTDEDAAQEKFPGMLQDKLIEPGHMSEMSTHKTQSADVTLPVQNLEELNAKLSEQIMSQIKTDKKSLEVQLEPHNLGKILIKVAYEKDQMSVSVVCTESKTLKLLSQSAGELGNILENNLERPVHVIVDKHQADYLNSGQEHQGNGREQQEHRQNQSDDVGDDFIQKLRLGISDLDSDDMNE